MKASLGGRYVFESEKSVAASASASAAATLAVPAGDLKLTASMTDATFSNGPSLSGLVLSLQKPGSFVVNYDVPKKDFRFQFLNKVRVLEKPVNLTYIHCVADKRTLLEGTLVLDPPNKISASHTLGSAMPNGKLKYSYVHRGVIVFEPSYDFGKKYWDFALSRKLFEDDVVKASYISSNRNLGLEWSRNSKTNGCFKVSAVFNLEEELKMPKLTAETTWNLEV